MDSAELSQQAVGLPGHGRRRRLRLKWFALGLGAVLALLLLAAAGWFAWTFVLRPPPDGFAPTSGQAVAVPGQPEGVVQYTVDARSRQDWVYFSFASDTAVSTTQDSIDWDIAFRRTDILTNSGETNPEGLGGAIDLGNVPLEEAQPPVDGHVLDATDDERGLENHALHGWYSYNWTTHIVGSKNHTYSVRTAAGEAVLVTFSSYYCGDGSPGCVTFQYRHAEGR